MAPPPDEPTAVQRVLALKASEFFSDVPPEELAALAQRSRFREFEAGEPVVAPARAVPAAHFVLRGEMEERRGGRQVRRRSAYHLVGALSALAGTDPRFSVVAASPAQTLEIDRPSLLELMEEHFGLLVAVMGEAARELMATVHDAGGLGARREALSAAAAPPAPVLSLAQRIEFLREIAILRHASVRGLGDLAIESEQHRYAAGDTLWRAGDGADHVVAVVAGAVECVPGGDRPAFLLGRGAVVGLGDCLARQPRAAHATAATDLAALRMEIGTLLDVLEDEPEMTIGTLVRVSRYVTRRLGRAAGGEAAP